MSSYSPFYPKFRCHGNGGQSGEMRLATFNGPFPKTPYRRKKSRTCLLHKASYGLFCPEFCCDGNRGRSRNNAIGSIRWHIPETPL